MQEGQGDRMSQVQGGEDMNRDVVRGPMMVKLVEEMLVECQEGEEDEP